MKIYQRPKTASWEEGQGFARPRSSFGATQPSLGDSSSANLQVGKVDFRKLRFWILPNILTQHGVRRVCANG